MQFHYVYIITNTANGKQYVGDRTCSVDPYLDKYMGSGIAIKKAIRKYGIEQFKKEILEIVDTKNTAFDAQEKYIIKYDTLSPHGYNISPKGGYGVPNSLLNESTKIKIREKLKGKNKQSFIKCNIENKKGKSYEYQMALLYGDELGHIKAKEYKHKLSIKSKNQNGMKDRGYMVSGEKNGMYGKPSPMRGVKRTEDSKIKMSLCKIGVKRNTHECPYCHRKISDGNFQRWHGDNCKLKPNL